MSVGAAEDLLRAVAGAAKLKRLCLQVAQLLQPGLDRCANSKRGWHDLVPI